MQVNAFERKVADLDKHNQARALNRQEFLQLLVHVALMRYVRKGKIKDFSDAVEEMIRFDVVANLPAAATQNSDVWRRHNCYNEHVDIVLRKHLQSLQNLYGRYSELERDVQNKLTSDKNMSIGEWLGFISHLGFIKIGFLTQHESRLSASRRLDPTSSTFHESPV